MFFVLIFAVNIKMLRREYDRSKGNILGFRYSYIDIFLACFCKTRWRDNKLPTLIVMPGIITKSFYAGNIAYNRSTRCSVDLNVVGVADCVQAKIYCRR